MLIPHHVRLSFSIPGRKGVWGARAGGGDQQWEADVTGVDSGEGQALATEEEREIEHGGKCENPLSLELVGRGDQSSQAEHYSTRL